MVANGASVQERLVRWLKQPMDLSRVTSVTMANSTGEAGRSLAQGAAGVNGRLVVFQEESLLSLNYRDLTISPSTQHPADDVTAGMADTHFNPTISMRTSSSSMSWDMMIRP